MVTLANHDGRSLLAVSGQFIGDLHEAAETQLNQVGLSVIAVTLNKGTDASGETWTVQDPT